jgi:hypothetical protein
MGLTNPDIKINDKEEPKQTTYIEVDKVDNKIKIIPTIKTSENLKQAKLVPIKKASNKIEVMSSIETTEEIHKYTNWAQEEDYFSTSLDKIILNSSIDKTFECNDGGLQFMDELRCELVLKQTPQTNNQPISQSEGSALHLWLTQVFAKKAKDFSDTYSQLFGDSDEDENYEEDAIAVSSFKTYYASDKKHIKEIDSGWYLPLTIQTKNLAAHREIWSEEIINKVTENKNSEKLYNIIDNSLLQKNKLEIKDNTNPLQLYIVGTDVAKKKSIFDEKSENNLNLSHKLNENTINKSLGGSFNIELSERRGISTWAATKNFYLDNNSHPVLKETKFNEDDFFP